MDELGLSGSGQAHLDQYLTIRLGQQEFGIAILDVQEIRGWTAATPVPNAPQHFRGVINLRGTVVPVLDLRRKFRMAVPDDDRLSVTVVVRVGGRVVGLVVDGVSDVLDITPDAISPPPSIGEGFEVTSLSGIARSGDRLVSILSMAHIVGEEDLSVAA